MINAQDIKIGTAIRMDGKLYFCIDFLHVKPGKGNTFMRTKLKDVVNSIHGSQYNSCATCMITGSRVLLLISR